MNRLCDTDRWKESWFLSLTSLEKVAWGFIHDHCDNAGVWDPGMSRLADLAICGEEEKVKMDWAALLEKLKPVRLDLLSNGLWWDRLFIGDQCRGKLSDSIEHRPHQHIIKLLVKHGLVDRYRDTERKLYGESVFVVPLTPMAREPKPTQLPKQASLPMKVNGDAEKAVDVLNFLNSEASKKFSPLSKPSIRLITRALGEVSGDVEGIKTMIARSVRSWKGTKYEEYLQPSTLFAPEKFRERYDKRNDPIVGDATTQTKTTTNDHKSGFFKGRKTS